MSTERSRNGADRADNGVCRSGAVSGHSRKRLNRSAAWNGRPWSGRRVESGCHKNRLERDRQIGCSRSAHMLFRGPTNHL